MKAEKARKKMKARKNQRHESMQARKARNLPHSNIILLFANNSVTKLLQVSKIFTIPKFV